jgi:hypothetical protein
MGNVHRRPAFVEPPSFWDERRTTPYFLLALPPSQHCCDEGDLAARVGAHSLTIGIARRSSLND